MIYRAVFEEYESFISCLNRDAINLCCELIHSLKILYLNVEKCPSHRVNFFFGLGDRGKKIDGATINSFGSFNMK
jgi:hypothetical protein